MKRIALVAIFMTLPLVISSELSINIGGIAFAEEKKAEPKKTRRVPAMRERTYKTLSEAQLLIDPDSVPVEEGEERPAIVADPQAAVKMLKDALGKRGMNSYEAAQIWNTLAFAYYTIGDNDLTIDAYNQVLNQGTITEALEQAALRALFQLYFQKEDYAKAIEYIDKWQALKAVPDVNTIFLKATAYYQMEEYRNSLEQALEVERQAIAQEKNVKENWWYLQVVLYNELKDYDSVITVLEKLIIRFPKKQYWMHLAGMYSEKDWNDKALSAYYAAFKQGLLNRESEVVMLAQRLLNAEVPFEAASIIEDGIKDGMIEENEKHIKLLAMAYTMAQEMDKAIEAWRDATKFADDGNLHYRLAQALSNEDRHKEAVSAYEAALEAGGLDDAEDVSFWMGISLMQLEDWPKATAAFRLASKDKEKAKQCRQYIRYIDGEQKRQKALKEMLES